MSLTSIASLNSFNVLNYIYFLKWWQHSYMLNYTLLHFFVSCNSVISKLLCICLYLANKVLILLLLLLLCEVTSRRPHFGTHRHSDEPMDEPNTHLCFILACGSTRHLVTND